MTAQALDILRDTLLRKIEIMNALEDYTDKQSGLLAAEELDLDAFEEVTASKDVLVDQLSKLDDGFQSLYDSVADSIKADPKAFSAQVKALQELVTEVTDMSVSLEVAEKRNKATLDRRIAAVRTGMKRGRRSTAVAMNYYKQMSGARYRDAGIVDEKH